MANAFTGVVLHGGYRRRVKRETHGATITPFQSILNDSWHVEEIYLQPQTTLNNSCLATVGGAQNLLDFHLYTTPGKRYFNLILQFDINESGGVNPVNVAMTPWFVQRIEFRDSGNQLIQTLYSYNLFKNLNLLSDEQFRHWAPLMLIDPETWDPSPDATLQPGASTRVFLPLLGDIFSSNNGIPSLWKGYLIMRLYLQNAVESGSGILNCSNISLRIGTRHEDLGYRLLQPIEMHFIDYLTVTTGNYILGANETKILLQNAIGWDVEDDIIIGTNLNSVSGGAYRNWISLGRKAQIELLDQNNKNINGGSTLDVDEERYLRAAKHYSGDFFIKNYVIPFIYGNVELALQVGALDGAVYQDTHNSIGISTSPNAFQAPVITITPSGTGASGYYYLVFNDPVSNISCQTNVLAYNATASQIQSALYSLPNWVSLQTVTVSGPLTAAATFTFGGELYGNEFATQINASTLMAVSISVETSAATFVTFSSALSQAGNDGFTNNNSLNVAIYHHIMRKLVMYPDGTMKVLDIPWH